MNKLAAVLGTTTLAFALSTVYLARELSIERGRPPPPAAPTSTAVAAETAAQFGSRQRSADARAGKAPGSKDAPQLPELDERQRFDARMRAEQEAQGRGFLRMMDDPQSRAELSEVTKTAQRQGYPKLDVILGLDSAGWEALLDLLTEQQLTSRARVVKCSFEPACDHMNPDPGGQETRNQQLAALLGSDKYERFTAYMSSTMERRDVDTFRSRLPENLSVSNEQAEQLISALAAERERLDREVTARGAGFNGLGTFGGMIYYSSAASTFEQRMESASEYSGRLRQRAAEILTKPQSVRFDQAQDEGLRALRIYLREQQTGAADH
jgi:hypothetical protein